MIYRYKHAQIGKIHSMLSNRISDKAACRRNCLVFRPFMNVDFKWNIEPV